MHSRFLGGILLIAGTSIGGGMLALPIANAAAGFWPSSFFLLICWVLMTAGAFLILEVNLYLPAGAHMISMARATLGMPGLITAWLSYLLLLYTLLCAYISGGGDVLGSLTNRIQLPLSEWQAIVGFTLLFGIIVYRGIHSVDWVNRFLMFGKLGAYVLLVFLIAPHIEARDLSQGNYHHVAETAMILITSFGFAIIIPNLRVYFNNDLPTLRRVIWIGSAIPLICYLAWNAVIMGTLPTSGPNGVASLMQNSHPTSTLAMMLEQAIHNSFITSLFNFFTSICMLTAFLSVALCLISFISDGLKMAQSGKEGLILLLLTFLPPLLIVLFYPGAYLKALNYAGIFCVILLLILPAWMALRGRASFKPSYVVPSGRCIPIIVIAFSCLLLFNAFWPVF